MLTKFWSESLEGKTLRRPRRRWEDNIRMDLRELWRMCGLDSSGSREGPDEEFLD